MSKYALEVKNVSKSFRLPTEQANGIKQAFVNWTKGVKGYKEQHVLKDISFKVEKGDFFGIVGRNGSGKSTLLKIISQIYTPEKGEVKVNGTLIPFIELGVGFNPELTGRENVYMNGALLGFSREEVSKMYPEIVEFAELEEFMDQKLKNYSSGMQVRLAFSIAIKAQGDILVLDEVLAVGDEAFQRKCFEYFRKLKKDNKTVILVTHDMSSVKKFCNKAIMIESGRIVECGDPETVANRYTMSNIDSENNKHDNDNKKDTKEGSPWIKVKLISKSVVSSKDKFIAEIRYFVPEDLRVGFGISIIDAATDKTTSIVNDGLLKRDGSMKISSDKAGEHSFRYELELDQFNNRNFDVTAALFRYDSDQDNFLPYAFIEKEDIVSFAIRGEKPDNGLLKLKGEWTNGSNSEDNA